MTTPFFWNLAPNYDVTFSPTILSRQGLLMQGAMAPPPAQRLRTASAPPGSSSTIRTPSTDNGESLSGDREFRGGVRTVGAFDLSPNWIFGWALDATTDRTFNRDYSIPGADSKDLLSTIYLTGMNERNYFDVSGDYFTRPAREHRGGPPDDGDPTTPDVYVHDDQAEQAFVHPVLDHNFIVGHSVAGGELAFDSNLTSVTRDESDIRHPPAPFSPISPASPAHSRARRAARAGSGG